MDGSLSFDSNSLQTYSASTRVGIITNSIDHTDLPTKAMEIYSRADADGSAVLNPTYPDKKIQIAGAIVGSSAADLDNRIDAFKLIFNGKEKNLDITYGSGTRRYTSTANTISIKREQRSNFAVFTVEFICSVPFGVDTVTTTLINQLAFTGATYSVAPTIGGSAPYQLPVFNITINSLTGTGDYIQLANNNNGQDMLLLGLGITAGDVLNIDSTTRKVSLTRSGVTSLKDWKGTFLELEPGAGSLTYTDGFSTRSVDIVANYYKRWQ